MGLLDGKRLLVTGVLTDASLAFAVAELAQREGADVVLSGAGRGLSLTRRTARKLPRPTDVLELDVTDAAQVASAGTQLAERWDRLDGLLHAIGYAPPECLGGDIFRAGWQEVSQAVEVSAYSLKVLVEAFRPLLAAAARGGSGASVVGLDFDATVAWPAYDWMGVSKAALEYWPATSPVTWGPRESASTSSLPDRSRPWQPSPSPALPPSKTRGRPERRLVGTSSTAAWWLEPASRCSPTCSPRRPARSSTSTVASTLWVPERAQPP